MGAKIFPYIVSFDISFKRCWMRVYLFLMSANLIENVLSQKFLQALLCSTVSRTFQQSLERLHFFCLFVCPQVVKVIWFKKESPFLVSIILEMIKITYCIVRCKYLWWVPLLQCILSIFPASVHQFYVNILVFVNINPFLYINDQFALLDISPIISQTLSHP